MGPFRCDCCCNHCCKRVEANFAKWPLRSELGSLHLCKRANQQYLALQFGTIPEGIGALTALERLVLLGRHRITSLPESISRYRARSSFTHQFRAVRTPVTSWYTACAAWQFINKNIIVLGSSPASSHRHNSLYACDRKQSFTVWGLHDRTFRALLAGCSGFCHWRCCTASAAGNAAQHLRCRRA
jgi:hypothetical protein